MVGNGRKTGAATSLPRSSLVRSSRKSRSNICTADQVGQIAIVARHPSPVPVVRPLVWRGYDVVGGASGFAVVDLQTGAARHFCHAPLGHRWAYTIAADAVFFDRGTHLMTATITKRA